MTASSPPARRVPLARRWSAPPKPFGAGATDFSCRTEDGVALAGTALGDPSAATALVVAHGFMGYRTKPTSRRLVEALAERHRVFAFDLRGHGDSGGACTGGAVEHLDVHAVVEHARAAGHERIVTVGWSLGGIAVVRHAAMFDGLAGVVAISTPSRWGSDSKAVRRTTWLFTSRLGRALAREVMGTRIDLRLDMPDSPVEVVSRIAPTPLVLVHGTDDHFFGPEAARELHAAASEPKRLVLLDRFGHAEDGFSAAFARLVLREIDALPALAPVASA